MNNKSTSTSKVRVGIVGAGLISDIHVRGIARIPDVEIVGIVDADADRAGAKAAQHGIPHAFGSQREMLRSVAPDVVHILTPPATHADLCVEALEAGAHVYVEKPMAVDVSSCDRMIAAAARAGRELCVGHCMVQDPLMHRALQMIAAGELGEVLHAHAVYCFDPARIPDFSGKAWYRELGGGFLEDLASHPASLLVRLLGATRIVDRAGGGDDGSEGVSVGAISPNVAGIVGCERGTGTLFVSLDARPEEVSLEIRATKGTLRLDFSSMVMTVQRDRRLPKKLAHGARNIEMAGQLAIQTATSTARFVAGRIDATKGIHSLIEAFYQAIRAVAPAPVSGEEGRLVVELLRRLWPEPAPRRPKRWVLSPEGTRGDEQPVTARATVPSAAGAAAFAGSNGRPTALVTGATGFIGEHLVRSLVARGVFVRALARNAEKARRLLGPNVEMVIGDFGDPDVIAGLATGMHTVFHLASAMTGAEEVFARVDIAGAQALIAEAERAGVRRFIFTSTMGAYALAGRRDGDVITEEMIDVPERVGRYARAKLLVERMLAGAHRDGAFEAVVVRPGLVFGPGASPFLEHLPHLGTLRGDRYIVFGDGCVTLQLTYVENTVDALLLCASSANAAGATFTLVDDNVPTQKEYVNRLREFTGRPLRVATIPRSAAWLIGAGVEGASAALKRKPPTTRRLLLGKTAKLHFDCSRAKRELGWNPVVGWEEGLRRTVAWANAQPGVRTHRPTSAEVSRIVTASQEVASSIESR